VLDEVKHFEIADRLYHADAIHSQSCFLEATPRSGMCRKDDLTLESELAEHVRQNSDALRVIDV
jgi:hypothetical protein